MLDADTRLEIACKRHVVVPRISGDDDPLALSPIAACILACCEGADAMLCIFTKTARGAMTIEAVSSRMPCPVRR